MAALGKSSLFDRKLSELQQEAERLDDHIRSLSKNIRKIESSGDFPASTPMKSGPRLKSTALSTASARGNEPVEKVFALSEPPIQETDEESAELPELAPSEPVLPGFTTAGAERRKPAADNLRFASYLASGSFGKARPLSQEKKVLRNKAIFMVLFAVIAAIMLFRMIF
jgi:hypothetical protein